MAAVLACAAVGLLVFVLHTFTGTPSPSTAPPSTSGAPSAAPSASSEPSGSPGPTGSTGSAIGAAQQYYVDCSTGSDSNAGTSTTAPWRTLEPISMHFFAAGSTIHLRTNCTFDGDITLKGNGTSSARVLLTSYGSGSKPVVRSAGSNQNAVQLTGSHQTVEKLKIINSYDAAVSLGGSYDVAQHLELTDDGVGVQVQSGGDHSLVTHNVAYDLRMVVNTPGGNDDYGAVGYSVASTDVTISHNSCTRCVAPSYDYGVDGGFVEVFNEGENLHVFDNVSKGSNGFIEVGGSASDDRADNMRLDHNIIINSVIAVHVNTNDQYAISVKNLLFEYNTFVQTQKTQYDVFYGARDTTSVRNNIFYLASGESMGASPYVHTNNVYYRPGAANPGYQLHSGELMGNPRFVDMAKDDYRLQAGSPAIGAGRVLPSYTRDYDGNRIGSDPDAGAIQHLQG